MLVVSSRPPHSLAHLVRVERDGNPLRRFGHASPFIGKLAALDGDALGLIAHTTWCHLPHLTGRTLVVGMTESSLLLSWFIARQAPQPVELRFTTRKQRQLPEGDLTWRTFEEPHSHGPRHFIALEQGAHFDQVVIVEDELTTGATLRNLLFELQGITSRFFVVTLNDMRPELLKRGLECDLMARGTMLQTLDLTLTPQLQTQVKRRAPKISETKFNPFQRRKEDWDISRRALDENWQNQQFGTIYIVGECVDIPLAYWSALSASRRPAIQHITRSPWKVDGEVIHTRAGFPGDGTTSRYFLYNFAPLASQALILCEQSNVSIAAQAREFLGSEGVEAQCITVAGT